MSWIGKEINKAMDKLEMTQQDIGIAGVCSPGRLSKYVNGHGIPKRDKIIAFAKLFSQRGLNWYFDHNRSVLTVDGVEYEVPRDVNGLLTKKELYETRYRYRAGNGINRLRPQTTIPYSSV